MRSLDRAFKSRLNGTGLKPLVQYIKDLFNNNEQGVWYDPSDLSTLFQDAAGTIPVTAVEQPVGLMLDKSKGLVLGAELATFGLDFNTWQKTAAVTSVGVGTFTTSGEGGIYQWVSGVKNSAHYQVRVVGSTPVSMTIRNSNGTSGAHTVSPGAFDVTLRSQLFAEGEAIYFLANGAGTVNITSLSIRELPGAPARQATATSRPVLKQDANGCYYLKFDGTDDWLVTPSIDFTSTDKMMVCAGVRKLSNAGIGCVVELSNSFANNQVFMVYAPDGGNKYEFGSRGTAPSLAQTTSAVFNAPTTNVLTGVGDIAGANSVLRINGSEIAKNSANQGTGTYGNYPLYIGRRAGAAYPFNGHLYGLIIRGAATSDSQIKSTEKYINAKTRAYTT